MYQSEKVAMVSPRAHWVAGWAASLAALLFAQPSNVLDAPVVAVPVVLQALMLPACPG